MTCAKGIQQVERWTFQATDQDIGRCPLILEVTDGTRLSNGVHPAAEGYCQIGDTIYCWLKAQLAVDVSTPKP